MAERQERARLRRRSKASSAPPPAHPQSRRPRRPPADLAERALAFNRPRKPVSRITAAGELSG
jgi:hypothetical protein